MICSVTEPLKPRRIVSFTGAVVKKLQLDLRLQGTPIAWNENQVVSISAALWQSGDRRKIELYERSPQRMVFEEIKGL